MQSHFEKELATLRESLLTMASHAETAVRNAVDAVVRRDEALAVRVRENDVVIDQYEVDIDESAVNLLAKAPLASDLRLIMVCTKVSQNLERIGDEASKIAKRAQELIQEPPSPKMTEVAALADRALHLLREALDSFVNQDGAAARHLIPQDKEIDLINKQIHRDLALEMAQSPDRIHLCLHLMVVAKSLERIADHAKNVAEEVVYLTEAQDIRHTRPGAAQETA